MIEEDNILYDLMNWGAMEALAYGEHDDPHSWLGPHTTRKGALYNTFQPAAKDVTLVIGKKKYPMDSVDDLGNFSVLVEGQEINRYGYKYQITYVDGVKGELIDPYCFEPMISAEDEDRFIRGVHYDIYNRLGAHVRTVHGIKGTHFAVWAPNAERVSVVGDFNFWDGKRYPMRKLRAAGIFELFIPGIEENSLYKFEIRTDSGMTFMKADPYAAFSEVRPANASIVADFSYDWQDDAWIKARAKADIKTMPMSIYEVHLGSWKRKEDGSFYSYRELAPMLADYIKQQGYTHIELMPIMEHPFDGSWGYQVTGYFAPTSRYGSPKDFMYFVEYMHKQGIGVILDWVPAHFPKDAFALAKFDGTCLYEHKDTRLGEHPDWGTLIFDFGRAEVSNFLIASALFWVDKYHADGIRMDAVASMLYLDYGRKDGEWVANRYGGNENLEVIELLHHLNSIFHKQGQGAIIIAEESTAWPKVTSPVEDDGLGFDFKWNMGWMNDFTSYMKQDPLFRKGCHGQLTFSMMYAYSENFVLVLSHDEVVHGKCSMLNKMPGYRQDKFDNLRAAYGFMTGHPGRKLLFMGQEFAQDREWSEERELDWNLLEDPSNLAMQKYTADLNKLYTSSPALLALDNDPEGFKWLSCLDADHSIVSFIRSDGVPDHTLLFVVNFTPVVYDKFIQPVPFDGTFKEILCSDDVAYAGHGNTNPRAKKSKPEPKDGQDNSIVIKLAGMGVHVFSCKPSKAAKAELAAKETKEGKDAKETKASKTTKETKASKTTKATKATTSKTDKTAEASKTDKSAEDAAAAKATEESQPAKVTKTGKQISNKSAQKSK